MKWKRFFREGVTRFLAASCAAGLWLLAATAPVHGVSMQTYCNEPPFASAGIKPNLLLMMDNSASMYDAAYSDPPNYCVDNTYRDANSYAGYFDRNGIYRYDSAKGAFVADAALPSGSCSGNCAALTPYLYVEMTGNNPYRTVRSFIATGNFLNWLSASKVDIQKQVLTGGKWDPGSGVLVGEGRGCDGKRMVKIAPEATGITFAVRGPTHNDADFTGASSQGGATRIEIYDKSYNRDACLKAVKAWLNGDRGELLTQSNACLDAKLEPAKKGGGTMPTAAAVHNQVMLDCFDYERSGSISFDQTLYDLCFNRCTGLFGSCSSDDATLAEKLATLDGICAARVKHGLALGYLGMCLSTKFDNLCVMSQTSEYCKELRKPYLGDPSSSANIDGVPSSMPTYILDAATANLGDVSGTFNARVLVGSPPRGLIQEYGSGVNFGVMVFNSHGATQAECTSGGVQYAKHCGSNPARECFENSDCSGLCSDGIEGGKILSYINDSPSVGDHTSGLVFAVDNITPLTWTPYAEAFYSAIGYFANRSDLRLNSDDFLVEKPPPSKFSCQRNHILIVSDGMSTMDANDKVKELAKLYGSYPPGSDGSCPWLMGSSRLDDLAWLASHRDIKTFRTTAPASTEVPTTPSQYITTHVIFTGVSNGAPGQCDPAVLMRDTAASGGGVYAAVSDPGALADRFRDVLRRVTEGGNTGSDASVISTGEGNGAVFLQEQFYPLKSFDGGATSASWVGEMNSLWYYIDPFLGTRPGAASTVRADSDQDRTLTLKKDQAVSFRYDPSANRTSAYLSNDSDGDGTPEGPEQGPLEIDQVKALWRAGYQLWSRDLTASPRTIYLPSQQKSLEVSGTGLMYLDKIPSLGSAIQRQLLNISSSTNSGDPTVQKVVDFVLGKDLSGDATVRGRKLNIPSAPQADFTSGKGVWRLGDIISSTPKLESSTPLANYHLAPPNGYSDITYAAFLSDPSVKYKDRNTVYVGANDGMLHAFKFGSLKSPAPDGSVASLEGADFGKEQWAFVPKNALPYLKYLLAPNYRHLYLVDGSITLADVNIGANNEWRTVLIGAMGLGGATCQTPGSNCVQTPGSGAGYSSYFALDVTIPEKPVFLWEFFNPELGYATSGAAVIRSGDKWFAVFASGPTGPIDESACQFKGRSDRNLKIFVVDLKATGTLIRDSNYWVIDTKIPYAFAGSVTGGAVDVDAKFAKLDEVTKRPKLGNDDAVYLGYTRNTAADGSGTWTEGGVLRLLTKNSPLPSGGPGADNWSVSTVIDGVGPVTAGIARLVDRKNKKLWLYFGSGRYFSSADDLEGQRYLLGVQDRCFASGGGLDKNCDLAIKPGPEPEATGKGGTLALGDLREIDTEGRGDEKGWFIRLDGAGTSAGAERVITDPVALTSGAVLFTTFQPNKVPCQLDTSYLWRVKYDSGDAVTGSISGKALLPVSIGGTEQVDLSGAFGDRGNRRGAAMAGRPGGLRVISNSGLRPMRKIVHIQER
jgi:type IV pilus assembly protein PilY1